MRSNSLLLALAAALALLTSASASAGVLKVCADQDYLPFSNSAGQGFENDIAQAIAKYLGDTVEYTWSSYRGQGGFEAFLGVGTVMKVSFLHTHTRILSTVPVELLLAVDGKIIRAAIDWATIKHFIGRDSIGEDLVHDFLRKNRPGIELAIKANLFAHGVPLDRQLVLTLDDFGCLHPP